MTGARVGVIVDNPLRDLPGCALLAATIANQGGSAYLVPVLAQARELPAIAPDAVILNYLRPNNESLVRRLIDAGTAAFVLDTEGGVIPDFTTYEQTLTRDDELRARLSGYLAWGPALAEHLVRSSWYTKSQVAVTGSPRFDFYADPWRDAALRASAHIDRHPRPMLLLNGNFPLANPQFQSPSEELEMLVNRFGFDRALIERRQDDQAAALEGFVSLANRLARELDSTVVLRPHPFERMSTYEGLLERRANLILEREGAADGWILRSAAVLQRSCTTAIEAALAGVPALDISWLPAAAVMPAAEAVSERCPTYGELLTKAEACIAGDFAPSASTASALSDVIAKWFMTVDGHASQRVAATVLSRTQVVEAECRAEMYRAVRRQEGLRTQSKDALRRWIPAEVADSGISARRRAGGRSSKLFARSDVMRCLSPIMACGRLDADVKALAPPAALRWMRSVHIGAV